MGSKYEEKFGYRFVMDAYNKISGQILTELMSRFSNNQLVELDIAYREEMNIIETKIAGFYVLWHQNRVRISLIIRYIIRNMIGSLVDTLNGGNTYSRDNSRKNTYLETNIGTHLIKFDRTHSREKGKAPMIQDSANVSHRNFDLNKEPRFEDEMSERPKCDREKFLALYFSMGKTDTPNDKL
ncbi:hypothetical protein PIB30_000536 [Stylosanthes scabra]|uniref:Oxo-4-hydroxy-4-carboxy-5-ureidoimidazoline decarboxylase domain-containing protein n=1 Tax=Stylosanthes scabra TaxID=79078 RepID=A0ABU6W262_9FABA|nr:hypothetical protein [Stylosanthes scabra]